MIIILIGKRTTPISPPISPPSHFHCALSLSTESLKAVFLSAAKIVLPPIIK